jgi:hypothetical protein
MIKRIIFLDIDGVLNRHELQASGYAGMLPECVQSLNRIIDATDADIIISSAWRYLIEPSCMTIKGFICLMQSHGVKTWSDEKQRHRVIARTRDDSKDHHSDYIRDERGEQILEWIEQNDHVMSRIVVIDDLDLGISQTCLPFVQTVGSAGLTDQDAVKVINILKGVV